MATMTTTNAIADRRKAPPYPGKRKRAKSTEAVWLRPSHRGIFHCRPVTWLSSSSKFSPTGPPPSPVGGWPGMV